MVVVVGPTCWGNQLNGNFWFLGFRWVKEAVGPHLLGQSVEWKHIILRNIIGLHEFEGPTCWGNQLNGNLGSA